MTTAKEPGDSAGFLLWRVTLRWQRSIGKVLAPMDLTHAQFVLLASIARLNQDGEQPTQSQLAGHAGTDPMTTSQVVRTLESKGLIVRAVDKYDSRVKRLKATRPGSRLAFKAIAAVEAIDDEFFAPVNAATFVRTLQKLDAAE